MDRATCEALWFRPAKPYLRNAFLLMLGAAYVSDPRSDKRIFVAVLDDD